MFAAIGDPTRRRVLDLLARGNLPAGQIAAHFRVSRPAISQHLLVLRRAGLVSADRNGREHIYRLDPEPLHEVYDWIEHYRTFWTAKMNGLGAFLDGVSQPGVTKLRGGPHGA